MTFIKDKGFRFRSGTRLTVVVKPASNELKIAQYSSDTFAAGVDRS
ncbi:hypothetical protein [Paraburkholderia hospita]|nr:hypothetical protein [Paraburkholderia hospita]